MENGKFGLDILEKLKKASNKIADKIVKDIIAEVKENAGSPEKWPLAFPVGKVGEVADCPRILDALVEKLDQYGLIVYVGKHDYIMVDVLDMDLEEEPEEDIKDDIDELTEVKQDIPDSKGMTSLSKSFLVL